MNPFLGKLHFWLTIIPFNLIFIPMFINGLAGQNRRIYNYNHFPEMAVPTLQNLRIVATLSLVFMLLAQFIFLWNFFYSMFKGPKAGNNPWNATTLEWTTTSPAPHGNWKELPTCYRGPYEYSTPDGTLTSGHKMSHLQNKKGGLTNMFRPIANTRSNTGIPTGRLAVWWLLASEMSFSVEYWPRI